MSQINEIKCRNCGHWVTWNCRIDDKCPNCGAYLEPERYLHAEERKIAEEHKRTSGYLVIKDTDDNLTQIFKEFVNWLRWGTFYGISIIYVIIAIAVVLYGLVLL